MSSSRVSKSRQILLSSTMLFGALSGYAGRAYSACTFQGAYDGRNRYLCSDANDSTQSITLANSDNAEVLTEPGFSVYTTVSGGSALVITGNGEISYFDDNASDLRTASPGTALDIQSVMDDGTIAGSVTVQTNGDLYGETFGIYAKNGGTGAVNITATGDVSGGNDAIHAENGVGSGLTITTGSGTINSNANQGIYAYLGGSGTLRITSDSNIQADAEAISAGNKNGDGGVIITSNGSLNGQVGIRAETTGAGASVTITQNGTVRSDQTGISASVSPGGDNLTIQTGAAASIDAGVLGVAGYGIDAFNRGAGDLVIRAYGMIESFNDGIRARNELGGDLRVTTGGAITSASDNGIFATQNGTGLLQLNVNGDVTADAPGSGAAIYARNVSGSGATITTAAGTTLQGEYNGIAAYNDNASMTITANGNVNARNLDAIFAENTGVNLTIQTGASSTLDGDDAGIDANQNGTGTLNIAALGNVYGSSGSGIDVDTMAGSTEVNITTGSGLVRGFSGISADHLGNGDLKITAGGNVTGTSDQGIVANSASNMTITTQVGSTVSGSQGGIIAGTANPAAAINIFTGGVVTTTDYDGVYANSAGGTMNITVGRQSRIDSGGGADDFAVDTEGGPTNLIVSGTLQGTGGAGAVQFEDVATFSDRLELRQGFNIIGNVFAGPGTDALEFGGSGSESFNLDTIDDGAGAAEQYQEFEEFNVIAGEWTFSGATNEAFSVEGGTMMGTGTFGGLTVTGGTLAPGNSIGTMTVNGAFVLGPNATFEVEVDAGGQSDLVIVNGTVNLTGATLRVLAQGGNYATRTEYLIVRNDGTDPVVGQFGSITTNFAFLDPSVDYFGGTGNDVVLILERNETLFQDVARTRNQRAVAGALDRFRTDNALYLAILNQTEAGALQAFDALSGEIHATVAGTLADDSRYAREAVLGRLMQATHSGEALAAGGPQVASLDSQAYALGYGDGSKSLVMPEPAPLAFWTRAYGAWGDFNGDGNAATADRDLGGFVSGMDASIGGSWRAGLATGASFADVDVDARSSSADVESYTLGGYLGGMAGGFALRGGGLWAWSDIDTSRAVIFPGFFERQTASYDADTGQLFGEIAYPTQMGGMALEPFGGLAFVSIDTDSFRERGGPLASLRGFDIDQDVGYSTLGLRAATTTMWGGVQVTPNLAVAWQHAFDDVTPDASLAFATTGIGFTVYGVPLAEDSALIDAGLDFTLGPNTTAGVSYTGQFGDGVSDNGVKGRFTWLF